MSGAGGAVPRRPPGRARQATLLGWGVGAVATAYLLAYPPTLNPADESFALYGAKRVWQGQALYRDFFDFQTPFSFYLYAIGYALGGVSITSARVVTALMNGLSAACTYVLARRVASTPEAILAGLLVPVICVPTWNLAGHHWPATAFGLAAAAVLLAPGWAGSARSRPAAAGALVGLLACTQASRGASMIPWLVVVVPALALGYGRGWRGAARELAWTAAGGAAVCAAVFGYAVWRASLDEVTYATFTWVVTSYRQHNAGKTPWAGSGWIWAARQADTWMWLLHAVPWLLRLEAVWIVWDGWRFGIGTQGVRTAVLLLALSAIAGIAYFPDYVHVSFIMPFVLVVLAGMVHRVWAALPGLPRGLAVGLWTAAFAVVAVKAGANLQRARAAAPMRFDTAFGTLAGLPAHAETVRELRARLDVERNGPPPLFAHPTDAWLYLALPADNPTRYTLLRPGYNTPEQFAEALADIERDPRTAVVFNILGELPDDPVRERLEAHWQETARFGAVGEGFRLYRLFQRPPAR